MRMASRILFFLCLLVSVARATPLEDAYLAARDKYILKIKAMEKAKASDEKVDAEHGKARADLETRLRGLLSDVSVKGFPAIIPSDRSLFDSAKTARTQFLRRSTRTISHR